MFAHESHRFPFHCATVYSRASHLFFRSQGIKLTFKPKLSQRNHCFAHIDIVITEPCRNPANGLLWSLQLPSSDGSLSDQCPCFINIGKLSLRSRHIGTLSWYGCLVCPLSFALQDVWKWKTKRQRSRLTRPINIRIKYSRYWKLDRYSSQVSGTLGLIHGHCQGETQWRIHVTHSANPWKMKHRARLFRTWKVIHDVPLPSAATLYLRESSRLTPGRLTWNEMCFEQVSSLRSRVETDAAWQVEVWWRPSAGAGNGQV